MANKRELFYFSVRFSGSSNMVVNAENERRNSTDYPYSSGTALRITLTGSLDDYDYPWAKEFDECSVRFLFWDHVQSGRAVGDVEAIKNDDWSWDSDDDEDDENAKRYNLLYVDLILPTHAFAAVSQRLASTRHGRCAVTIYVKEDLRQWANQKEPPLLNVEKFEFVGEIIEKAEVETSDTINDDTPLHRWLRLQQERDKRTNIGALILLGLLAVMFLIELL